MPEFAELSDLPLAKKNPSKPEAVRTKVSKKMLTCLHEAGHAAVAIWRGMRVDLLAVDMKGFPSVDGCHAPTGVTQYSSDEDDWERDGPARARRFASICLAGLAAESIAKGAKKPLFGGMDFQQAMVALHAEYSDPDEAHHLCHLLFLRTRTYLERKWDLVKAVAWRLAKKNRLTGAEIEAIVRSQSSIAGTESTE